MAARVLAPGDPGRALRLAQALTSQPKMVNHNRGLWGYTGTAADGEPLTIQSTGLGGASAAAIVGDLALLGAERIVRVGTCVACDGLALGTLVTASEVHALDGASRALATEPRVTPVAGLEAVAVASTDLVTEPVPAGARVRDLTSGAVACAAAAFGMSAAVVLVVVGEGFDDDAVHAAELELGEIALSAFA